MIHSSLRIVSIIVLLTCLLGKMATAVAANNQQLSMDLRKNYNSCINHSQSNLGFQSCAQSAEASIDRVLYQQYFPYLTQNSEMVRYYTETFFKSFETFAENLCQVSNSYMYSQSGFDVALLNCRFMLKARLREYLQDTYSCHQKRLAKRNALAELFDSCPQFRLRQGERSQPLQDLQPLVNHYHHFMKKYYRASRAKEITGDLDRRTSQALLEYNQYVVNYCAMSSFLLDAGSNKNEAKCRSFMSSQFKKFLDSVFDARDFL